MVRQHQLLRRVGLRHRGGCAAVLQQARARPDARRSGHAGGDPPVSAAKSHRQPRRGQAAPEHRAANDGGRRIPLGRAGPGRPGRTAERAALHRPLRHRGAAFFDLCPRRSRNHSERSRPGRRPAGHARRAAHLHHPGRRFATSDGMCRPEPGHPPGWDGPARHVEYRRRDVLCCRQLPDADPAGHDRCRSRSDQCGGSRAARRHRRSAVDGRQRGFLERRHPGQLQCRPGAAPTRLGLQAHRLHGGVLAGGTAGLSHRHHCRDHDLRCAAGVRQRRPALYAGEHRPAVSRPDERARCAGEFLQRAARPDHERGRDRPGRAYRAPPGHQFAESGQPVRAGTGAGQR